MTRALLAGAIVVLVVQPAPAAVTEQDVADTLGDDLAGAAARLHRSLAAQQLELSTSTTLAGDKAQLEMKLSLTRLSADLAVASAQLADADRAGAQAARGAYATDVSQALNHYVQAVARTYNEWLKLTGEAQQRAQQGASQHVQTGFSDAMGAQQGSTQALLGTEWPDRSPALVPTLPDLSSQVDADARALADAERRIQRARVDYQAEVAEAFAACDRVLRGSAATDGPPRMSRTMNDAIAELAQVTTAQYAQYSAKVRNVVSGLPPSAAWGVAP
jgi:hypothetical protein